jgi:hypothetical protein
MLGILAQYWDRSQYYTMRGRKYKCLHRLQRSWMMNITAQKIGTGIQLAAADQGIGRPTAVGTTFSLHASLQ